MEGRVSEVSDGSPIQIYQLFLLVGFGFVTFDSQNVAETVRDMERVKFNDECDVVIGPARIRKKRFYLLPGTSGWNVPQPCYFQVILSGHFLLDPRCISARKYESSPLVRSFS